MFPSSVDRFIASVDRYTQRCKPEFCLGMTSSSLLVLVEVRLPQNCVVLVSGCRGVALWVEVSVFWLVAVALPSRLRCIAWLPRVLVRFSRTTGCCLGEVRSQDCSRLVSRLVLCYLRFVFLIIFRVSRLRWWDFVCPQDREVGLVSRALWALPDGGLVSAMGVWLAVSLVGVLASRRSFLFRVRERPVVCLLPLLSMGCLGWWCFHMAFGAMSRIVATFVVKGSVPCVQCEAAPGVVLFGLLVQASFRCVFCLCLGYAREALVTVWCVALLTYGGRSGALPFRLAISRFRPLVQSCLLWRVLPVRRVVSAIGATVLHPSKFWCLWWHPLLVLECFVRCSTSCSVFEALSFPPLGHFVLAVPCGSFCGSIVVVCPGRTTRMIWVRSSGAVEHSLARCGFSMCVFFDCFWVTIKKLSFGLAVGWQAGQSDLSGCRSAQSGRVLVMVWVAVAIRLVSRCPAPKASLSGDPAVRAWRSGDGSCEAVARRHGSEEECGLEVLMGVCMLLLLPPCSPPHGVLVVAFVGDQGMWIPHRDIREGVAPVGCDLLAAWMAVVIRIVSRPSCPSRQGGRDKTWSASGVSVATVGVSACAPGQDVPLGPSGGNAAMPCVPALADDPSGGCSWKGCRACLCQLGFPAHLCQRVLLRAAGVLKVQGGSACGPSTWWRSEVVVPVVRQCFSRGCSVSLVVTPGCSFLTSWRSGMLGARVMRLWSHVVALVSHELLYLGGCVPRVCFRIVLLWPDPGCGSWRCSSCFHMCFDSASSVGVVFGLTRFLLLWLVRD
ncbi:hypothetical protein Taro_055788, partial [Colocasia esculenta]|nr:hypothetical protein [Colocasia esculenta]